MKTIVLSILLAIGMTIAIALCVGDLEAENNQECQIIRIQEERGGGGKLLTIFPQSATIAKGTCVIWVNWAAREEVAVKFVEDGKKCEDASEAPMGFKMTPENCYVTSLVGVGGTSSLRFTQAGTFNYVVDATSGAKTATAPLGTPRELKASGTIIVQ